MKNGVASTASRDLQALFEVGSLGGLSDGQLLVRFVARQEEAVFEALVHRHGPMVWGVCRRVLRDHHDAEDAFQASFLVLARKAASVVPKEKLGNWLYGVANQTAMKARAMRAKRRVRESQVLEMPEPESITARPDERFSMLDRELSRLPEKYRIPIVLCELEGMTHKEAAEQLGWPIGTVSGRLSRARAMLSRRLFLGGISPSVGSLAVLLARESASASMPTRLIGPTAHAARLISAGRAATAGMVSAEVFALTREVIRVMVLGKLNAFAVVLLLGFMATGTVVLTYRTAAARGERPPTAEGGVEASRKQEKVEDVFTAWGKEVGGLQAGLGYHPGQRRAYSHGETVRLVIRVRNVSKEAIHFQYLWAFFVETSPTVKDGEGKPVTLGPFPEANGLHVPKMVDLKPGKEIKLYELKLNLRPAMNGNNDKSILDTLYGTGKVQIQYERVFGNSSAGTITLDPALGKLATGKLELEIKPEEPAGKEAATARVPKDEEAIQGIWAVTKLEQVDHKSSPEEEEFYKSGKFTVAIRGNMITYQIDNSSVFFKLDPLHPPKLMTLEVSDGPDKGRHVPAIYRLEGDDLMICQGRLGDTEPPSGFSITDRRPGTFPTLWVLRRRPKPPVAEKEADTARLQGIWTGVVAEVGGRRASPAENVPLPEAKVSIEGDELVLKGLAYGNVIAYLDSMETKFLFKVDVTADPRAIEMTIPPAPDDAAPSTYLGIYRLEGDDLTICLNIPNKKRPEGFKTQEKTQQMLLRLRRGPASDVKKSRKSIAPTPEQQQPAGKVPQGPSREVSSLRGHRLRLPSPTEQADRVKYFSFFVGAFWCGPRVSRLMPSSEYQFLTRWHVEGMTEEVFAILDEPEDMARWWPSVYLDVQLIEPGDERGVGKIVALLTKGWLPYKIRWSFRVTEKEPPSRITLDAWGDLDGHGEWTLTPQGSQVEARYDWRVRADKPLLRHLSFLFKPVFESNHRWAMARGEESLRRELARRRDQSGRDRFLIPPTTLPTSG